MGCCSSQDDDKANTKFGDGDNDLSEGPAKNRGCTDAWCLIVFAASWVLFVAVSALGLAQGDLAKLYMPRDYSGAYCDVEVNWNGGPNLQGFPKQSFMMNVSSVVDDIAKQMLCSSAVEDLMRNGGILNPAELNVYLAECCLVPSERCDAAIDTPVPITGGAQIAAIIPARMAQLTGGSGADLADPTSLNGDKFKEMFEEASKYFVSACVKDCSTGMTTLNDLVSGTIPRNPGDPEVRTHTYVPAMDNPLKTAWDKLKAATGVTAQSSTQRTTTLNGILTSVQTSLTTAFAFKALPLDFCPYTDAGKCVPMPGVDFQEIVAGSGYCTFTMAAEAAASVGGAAADTLGSMAGISTSGGGNDGIGEMMGYAVSSLDTIIVVALLTFVIGVVFLVILRFTVGVCVWTAVLITCLMFPFAGAMAYVRSGQCAGDGLLDSSSQVSSALVTMAKTAADGNGKSEEMTGMGADYKGGQYKTISGKSCKAWIDTTYTDTVNGVKQLKTFDNGAVLEGSYCRNPYNEADVNKARTIWCFTADPAVSWEVCAPIGVIQPACAKGYAVEGEQMRDLLKYLAYFLWITSIVWVVVILCFVSRIRLAINLNKAAAEFLAGSPQILLVPIVQAVVGIIWIIVWSFLAAFLLSQVPDGYMDTGAYATYAEAYGVDGAGWLDSGNPGACTDKWPTGGVYKADDCVMDDTVDPPVAKCWKCYPPRYVFDQYFAFSWFCFLWNNAFNIAMGQAIVAMAVCQWFFADKSQGRPSVVRPAIATICRYHLGTIAFGSFIIALIQFIRSVMRYLEEQAKAQKNQVMVYVFKIIGCLIWCFEKCMKFLNKNAYIQMALMGTNFCTSAKKAFFLILRNALRFGTVAVLGQVVHYIGVFCITIAASFIGYILLREMHSDIPPLAPVLCFCAIGYVVSEVYMSVFGMATDTCLQCFLACEEMGGHSNAPEIVKSILQNAEPKKEEGEADQA